MTPELIALSIILWAWLIALLIAPHFERQLGPASWPGRAFAGLARLLERGWNAVMHRG
ncbi:hypothetical protein ACFVWT_04200 [Arthrobacter sp. NPDC058288]|uniref:hypothetical protein n=1 Tax=Arthrobacter sp. NPDC058288 TaxID=3346424 RepID=UPI0036EB1534